MYYDFYCGLSKPKNTLCLANMILKEYIVSIDCKTYLRSFHDSASSLAAFSRL